MAPARTTRITLSLWMLKNVPLHNLDRIRNTCYFPVETFAVYIYTKELLHTVIFFLQWTTLCRSGVWIGMKVLGADSIILGTRKLWWMFPIKQKLNTTAAFWDKPKCSIFPNLDIFYQCAAGRSAGLVGKETAQWTIKKIVWF